jgi:hypothetical protein
VIVFYFGPFFIPQIRICINFSKNGSATHWPIFHNFIRSPCSPKCFF